jgi:hypothetical protein
MTIKQITSQDHHEIDAVSSYIVSEYTAGNLSMVCHKWNECWLLPERRAIVLYPKTTRQTLIHTTISQLGFRVAYKNVPLCTEGKESLS